MASIQLWSSKASDTFLGSIMLKKLTNPRERYKREKRKIEGASYQRFSKVKIHELKGYYAKLELRETDASVSNALCRVMIADVPTIAIDLVEIEVNSSILNDKFIAHHLGLIPITSERAMSMRFSRDCDACDGDGQCEFCSVEFHLRAKCINDQTLDVTSKDLYSSVTNHQGCFLYKSLGGNC